MEGRKRPRRLVRPTGPAALRAEGRRPLCDPVSLTVRYRLAVEDFWRGPGCHGADIQAVLDALPTVRSAGNGFCSAYRVKSYASSMAGRVSEGVVDKRYR